MSNNVSTSRIKNAKRNVMSGILKAIVVIVLNFLIRTAVIYILGFEYQGLSGLFTSILQVLNLTDFGFSAAVTFILYKPIAEDDIDTICAIIAFLKKVYRIIGIVILIIGLVLMPFLPKLISGSCPDDINIYILFIIYLFNTVISYFLFAYKSTLLSAYQREDVVSNVYTITMLSCKGIQFLLLLVFKNYYIFVMVVPIATIISNILLHLWSQRIFPNVIPKGKILLETKRTLIKQVKAVFINRMSDIARNSFDNIVLSLFLGLTVVAIYDNYYYIYSALYGFMGIIVHSIKAGVGNSLVNESVDKNYHDCMKFSFVFLWIVGWCTICMCCLYQPFMRVWMKGDENLLLSTSNMVLFCVYFYVISLVYTKNVYLEAQGLFWECKYWYICEAIGNLVLNILLGYFWGVTGILLATIITIVVFNYFGGTIVLFKFYFKRTPKYFFASQLFYLTITFFNGLGTYILCSYINFGGILDVIIKIAVCMVVPNIVFMVVYFRTKEFRESLDLIKRFIRKN